MQKIRSVAVISDIKLEDNITKDLESGSDVGATIDKLTSENDVIMFSKSTCPFCFELKRTLASYGVHFAVFEVNETSQMAAFKKALGDKTGTNTFPNLFIKGKSYGGCNAIKQLEHTGEFKILIASYLGRAIPEPAKISSTGFLWFPEVVNRHVMRLTSLLSFIMAVVIVGTHFYPGAKWAALALALDYVLRFCFGGAYSVGGTIASAILANYPAAFFAGPPKQFAAFCGLFMTTFSAALFISGEEVGGAVVMAGLAFAAGLEGIFDFCLGCWIFGQAISLGFLSPSVYRPYLNLLDDKKWGYTYNNTKRNLPNAKNEHVLLPGQDYETPVDLIRKDRLETEYKQEDFDLIKHAKVDFFAVPMGIAALAFAFKGGDDTVAGAKLGTGIAYQTLAIISVILFGLYGFLYIARLIMYPKKCLKEWRHPVMGNLFSAITICIILYGLLLFPQDSTGGITLVYIGAVTQMLISVLRVANLIYDWVSEEMVNASLMMTPVANFIGAIGYATYLSYSPYTANNNLNYLSISRLWFGVAALFAVTLFIITFRRALHDAHADVRMRPMLWVWLATFSISGPAFLLSTGTSTILGILAAKGLFYQSMWCISLFFAVVLSLGYIRGFFSYTEDMSMWVIPFAYSAFAINTVQYYRIVNDGESFMYVMSIISLVIASTSTAVTGLTTLQLLFDGTVFKPRPKWGPISFMKLTHECFRFALPKYQKIIESIDVADTLAVQYLIKDLDALFVTFMEHSRHEDEVLFPRLRRFFPGLNPAMDAEHEAAHTAVHKMEEAIHKYRDLIEDQHSTVGAVEMITVLKENFASWVEMVLPHLRNEESTITVAARKYLSLDYQMQISREVFDVTPASGWRLVIPFVVNNLPTAVWKSRYIKTFTWGYPSRAQEIGLMLYHSVDAITWLSIIKELPEIIPRGLPGHKRIY